MTTTFQHVRGGVALGRIRTTGFSRGCRQGRNRIRALHDRGETVVVKALTHRINLKEGAPISCLTERHLMDLNPGGRQYVQSGTHIRRDLGRHKDHPGTIRR